MTLILEGLFLSCSTTHKLHQHILAMIYERSTYEH
jgi:hypothetical protein